ncbi:amino acid ABC transporter permease [Halobacteriovorax sp. GB3]|uniref:amino acid ABC transporter permease n=1 Tax=Halobacteriovorax sp. GB3 TaxID=2719615 RepID=UPI00235F1788|nr:amino acid ABC transporter permease [Halobacteriovorax sp. GB3]MDD0853479.1 amino acid ABC transporter permease [Halobacteriovorax sp. GB3]
MQKWLKKNLFSSYINSFLTVVILFLLSYFSYQFIDWFFIKGVWRGDSSVCMQSEGACVSFIINKARFIIFGFYPDESLWRPITAMGLLFALVFYSKEPKRWNKRILYQWLAFFFWAYLLMKGGMLGLSTVDSSKWGGLPLTLMLSVIGIGASYPIGIILALGRRSKMPLIKSLCVGYIELIRGVPMISLLFMSSVMFPLFLPEGVQLNKLVRAQIAIIMFVSAYMAEVVRGGLQAVDQGQYEAAESLGLNYYQTMRYIILPQALKIVIPPSVNTAIGLFKDTSLVVIIALFDLLSGAKASVQDSEWLGFSVEAYLFVAAIYFIFCFAMGKYSRRLEYEFNTSRER